MWQYLMSFFKTKNKKHARLHLEIEGNSVRDSTVDTRQVLTKDVHGRSPTPMEPRELEWDLKPLERQSGELLQSPVQRPSEALGDKNKKRKRPRKKNIITDAPKNIKRLRKNETASLL